MPSFLKRCLQVLIALLWVQTFLSNCLFQVRRWLVLRVTAGLQYTPIHLSLVSSWADRRCGAYQVGKQPPAPRVLGVILSSEQEEPLQVTAVAQLIQWSAAAGLRHVLIYHPQGLLDGCQNKIHKQLGRLSQSSAVPYQCFVSIGFQEVRQCTQQPKGPCGAPIGCTCSCGAAHTAVHVQLLSPADAHWPLVAAAQTRPKFDNSNGPPHPCSAANGCLAAGASISNTSRAIVMPSASRLVSQLQEVAGPAAVREPELLLVFGNVLTLAGFPPWLVRFSEIYKGGMLREFSSAKLNYILQQYCKTKQRFGI